MSRLIKVGSCLLALAGMAACGPIEVRISKADGVRPITKSFSANINSDNFTCGDTIVGEDSSQQYVVTTTRIEGGCVFTFDQEVEVLSNADYQSIKQFKTAVRYVNRVEIEVQRMDFYDETGDRFDVETRIRDVEFWVNGARVLDREQIGRLPATFVIQGDGLKAIKQAVKNRESCKARIEAKVTILDKDRPNTLRCDFEAQPTIVLSSSEI